MGSHDSADSRKALVERFFDLLGGLRAAEWIKLWHDDGVFEQPYAPEGYPVRLRGIEAIYRHVGSIDQIFGDFAFEDLEIHVTDDPELVVATLRSESIVRATGKPYANEYIALFRIREGRVALYREYFNPLIVLEAFDGVQTLNAVFRIEP